MLHRCNTWDVTLFEALVLLFCGSCCVSANVWARHPDSPLCVFQRGPHTSKWWPSPSEGGRSEQGPLWRRRWRCLSDWGRSREQLPSLTGQLTVAYLTDTPDTADVRHSITRFWQFWSSGMLCCSVTSNLATRIVNVRAAGTCIHGSNKCVLDM